MAVPTLSELAVDPALFEGYRAAYETSSSHTAKANTFRVSRR